MRHFLRAFGLLAWGFALCVAAFAAPERGRLLFQGELPLAGRVTGHTSDLPVVASRCVNCHAVVAPASVAASAAASAPAIGTQAFGLALTPSGLTGAFKRRGGPPSRYDEASFCRVLRTGIDPAHVILPRSMPRYDVADADCGAIWSYLIREKTR